MTSELRNGRAPQRVSDALVWRRSQKRHRKSAAFAWLAAALSVLGTATAWANYSCTGTVNDVNVAPGTGVVMFSSSAGLTEVYLCLLEGNVSSGNGNVTPEQCKSMLALLMAAQISGQSVALSFSDSLTCTTHPGWAWLTGWYWGPDLHTN